MTDDQKEQFLRALREGHTVEMGARAEGVHRATCYKHRKTDANFAEAWDDAYESGTDVLEQVAIKRAIEHDSQLLMFMLKARRPEKFQDRQRLEHVRVDYRDAVEELELAAKRILDEDEEKLKEITHVGTDDARDN